MYKYIHFILFDMKLSPNQKKITSVVVIVLCVVGFVLLLVWLFGGFDSDGDGTLTSTSLTNLTSTSLSNLTSSITLETASGEPSTMVNVPMTTTSVPMTTSMLESMSEPMLESMSEPIVEQTAFIYEQKSDDFATCPSSTIMNITNAFARPTSNTAYATKGSADVTNITKGICDGNQSCAIYFRSDGIGAPFPGEQKKIQVHYRCV